MEVPMHDSPDKSKTGKPRPKGPESREDRLKVALKANMARRKAQAKDRSLVSAKAPEDNDKEDE
jgi:hypothetical protein